MTRFSFRRRRSSSPVRHRGCRLSPGNEKLLYFMQFIDDGSLKLLAYSYVIRYNRQCESRETGRPLIAGKEPWVIVEESVSVRNRNFSLMAIFTLTMFISAALLFLVQPMFARMVLPLLGGTPNVWNTAVVFYQFVLLIGYTYAHVATTRLGVRRQAMLHVIFLLLPFLMLPIAIPQGWTPPTEANPIPWLLALLMVAVGLPFFIVSTTSPLLQLWFAGTDHPAARDPYFLYAASNLGSMLGLLSYPFLLEPTLRLYEQSNLWAAGYGVLAICMFACAAITWRLRASTPRINQPTSTLSGGDSAKVTATRRLRWIVWAFIPSSLMLSVTTYLSADIASVPLLWIIPMAIYLLTFVLTFARKPIFRQQSILRAFRPMLLAMLYIFLTGLTHIWLAPFHLVGFFIVSMACHGVLAQDRPPPKHLTEFYLWIAVGGALGGMFNALLAPILFDSVPEYQLVLALAALSLVRKKDISSDPIARRRDLGLPLALGLIVSGMFLVLLLVGRKWNLNPQGVALVRALLALLPIVVLVGMSRRPLRFGLGITALVLVSIVFDAGPCAGNACEVVHAQRGFFGLHRVVYVQESGESYHWLLQGTTLHGTQNLDPARRQEPLAYFHRSGPIGHVFEALNEEQRLQEVAIVGLGVGSLACYSQPEQQWTFYEIDPLVTQTALDQRFFTYLSDCAPAAEIVLGDGRLSLATADEQRFDLIVLDAFNSDSIPVHLLSRESLALYLEKLAPHGLIAFNVSNRYLHTWRVAADLALDASLASMVQFHQVAEDEENLGSMPSIWVLVARNSEDFGKLASDTRWHKLEGEPVKDVWTDDYSSIISVLNLW
jgi:spermidine synthase